MRTRLPQMIFMKTTSGHCAFAQRQPKQQRLASKMSWKSRPAHWSSELLPEPFTVHEYTHALVEFAGCPELELHVGIKVIGKSSVLHECDVAVVDRDEARLCRANRVHPRASKVLIAAECKFYTSPIKLELGRGFLGLTSDIHRRERYFVTNNKSPSVTKLIAHHQSEWEFGVLPASQEAEALYHSFARAFRNYKAAW